MFIQYSAYYVLNAFGRNVTIFLVLKHRELLILVYNTAFIKYFLIV